ncbi:hypothetical protein [Fischerella sp. JS2]|uniref:hypothetical protein n=1 Tax=Fischerella sp. JS2 TaxID=2597771 RepID=UPI0028EBF4A2|nr:hypothetical protein [Fischerella sp. JS2]
MFLISALLLPSAGLAETRVHPPASKDTVKRNCNKQGGRYLEGGNVYGCVLPSGTRVACQEGENECISWKNKQQTLSRTTKLIIQNQFGVSTILTEDAAKSSYSKLVNTVQNITHNRRHYSHQ